MGTARWLGQYAAPAAGGGVRGQRRAARRIRQVVRLGGNRRLNRRHRLALWPRHPHRHWRRHICVLIRTAERWFAQRMVDRPGLGGRHGRLWGGIWGWRWFWWGWGWWRGVQWRGRRI